MAVMILDGAPAQQVWGNEGLAERSIASFLGFIERKLDVSIVRDMRGLSGGPPLVEPLRLAALLREKGVIRSFGRSPSLADEPRLKSWYAICNVPTSHQVGGTTWEDDADALYATLAEALERYIWYTCDDHFLHLIFDTVSGMAQRGVAIPPERFAGFSAQQRADHPERELREDALYRWVQGTSLVHDTPVYIPAQIISGMPMQADGQPEPHIRRPTTIGLATWPTKTGARLAGVIEQIEREAYMITWLNQLTLPRIPLAEVCAVDAALGRSIATCERYQLKVHALRLITDAPVHAVAVVLEDMSGHAPRFTIGLKAHRRLPYAIEKAMTEALRARRGYRLWERAGTPWDPKTPVGEIGHRERLYYWGVPENARQLEFLVQGAESGSVQAAWDSDSEEQHLERTLAWCAEKGFECIAVSLGSSGKNPTHLHVEMVVVPELQPAHLTEATRAFGGSRWKDVPALFGYTPRATPFADAPHPFS